MARRLPRQNFTLAVLACESGAKYEPVQVQKLFFLLDRNIANALGGAYFNFQPYDYGPFDKGVYEELEALSSRDKVHIEIAGDWSRKRYSLTPDGQRKGEELLQRLDPAAQQYIRKVSKFVRRLSFAQLVGAIYHAYPEMRANSIFRAAR